jgi:putative DNA primase/helicase
VSAADRRPLALDDVAAMLDRIPAVERETWLRVAMAIKAEFGDAGYETWDSWSQTADNYVPADAAAVWRSVTDGPVTIATLVHLAREHGWRPEIRERMGGNALPPRLPSRFKSLRAPGQDVGRRAYGLELHLRSNRDDAIVAQHGYVKRKGFEAAHGAGVAEDVRCRLWEGPQTCLVVPIREHGTGKVIAVQAINAEGTKVTFGSMTAEDGTPGYLLLGNDLDPDCRWFVVEGWADAVSVVFYAYNGNAVCAVAFGKGRLETIARQIVADYPSRKRPVIIEDAP